MEGIRSDGRSNCFHCCYCRMIRLMMKSCLCSFHGIQSWKPRHKRLSCFPKWFLVCCLLRFGLKWDPKMLIFSVKSFCRFVRCLYCGCFQMGSPLCLPCEFVVHMMTCPSAMETEADFLVSKGISLGRGESSG